MLGSQVHHHLPLTSEVQALRSVISSPLPTALGRGWAASSPCLLHCLQRTFHFLSESQSLGFSSGIP